MLQHYDDDVSGIREKLGNKENPGLSVTVPSQLALELASIVEAVMGGSSGGVCFFSI